MSKSSPFTGLKLSDQVGLDQRLFGSGQTSQPTKQRDNETTLARNNETTQRRSNVRAGQRTNEHASEQDNEATLPRDNGQTMTQTNEPPDHHRNEERPSAARKGPRQAPRFAFPGERLVERHSHDIFRDQVLWINRLKLELEEQYGKRVTSNSIVRLAIDRLRADFEKDGGEAITALLIEGPYEPDRERGQGGGGSGSGV
jgi:hypothetical protein